MRHGRILTCGMIAVLWGLGAVPARAQESPPPDPREAFEWHRKRAEDATLPAGVRIEAYSKMAEAWIRTQDGLELHRMDLAPAEQALRKALEIADLTPGESAIAWFNLGRFHQRQDRFEEARAAYTKAMEIDPSPTGKNRAARALASVWMSEGNVEEARAIYEQSGFDLLDLYSGAGLWDKVAELCEQRIANTNLDLQVRWHAFSQHPVWHRLNTDVKGLRDLCDRWLAFFVSSDSNRVLILLDKFKNAFPKHPSLTAWAAPLLLAAPNLSPADRDLVYSSQFSALAFLEQVSELVIVAGRAASDDRVSPKVRYLAGLITEAFSPKFRKGSVPKIVEERAATFPAPGLTLTEKREAILQTCRILLAAGRETEAREWYGVYSDRRSSWPRAVLACPFLSEAPKDITAWLSSPLVQDRSRAGRLNRPYGENLQFLLETDAAVTGRKTEAGSESREPAGWETDVWAACDSEGIWLFLLSRHPQLSDVANGLLPGGSYEGYLSAGAGQPYYFFLIEFPSGHLNAQFPTSYRHKSFRPAHMERGTLRTETRPCREGMATLLFYSWELFYDRLPVEGTEWPFETIRWTREGGVTFGGSRSVHNPSSWGALVFEGLKDDARRAIQRRLITKASDRYRQIRNAPGGPADWWADRDLGDPTFYTKSVRPRVERLDQLASEAAKRLGDEDVERLYREAVPGWMEFDLDVSDLRRAYLESIYMPAE